MRGEVANVFVVDDDAAVRRALGRLLRSAGYQPETFSSAEHFLKGSHLADPGCILVDIKLPGLNGLEVARRLRQELPQARIVVMSQYDPVHLLAGVMAAGGDACLDKSRLAADLVDSIKNLHPRDQQPAAAE